MSQWGCGKVGLLGADPPFLFLLAHASLRWRLHKSPGLASPQRRWSSYRCYLLDEAGPVRVNEGWTKISFQIGWRSFAAAGVRGTPSFAKNAKEPGTRCMVDESKIKTLGHPSREGSQKHQFER